jgi:hypothetical protein
LTSGFKPVERELSYLELDDYIAFENDGLYYTDSNGLKYKGFMYLRTGYTPEIAAKQKTSIPKFHVARCRTLIDMKINNRYDGNYVFSNEPVKLQDSLDGLMKDLTVCRNCAAIAKSVRIGMTTERYVHEVVKSSESKNNFLETDMPRDIPVDGSGYTRDWAEVSQWYRAKMNFTCEQCGIALNKIFAHRYYLETHHIDGNAKNNKEHNLRCLCVLCHANVDGHHVKNYEDIANASKVKSFVTIFANELILLNNKYIEEYIHKMTVPF